MCEIVRQRVKAKVGWNTIHAPWFSLALEEPKQQFTGIVFVVNLFIRYSQGRAHAGKARQRLSNQIKVLGCVQWQVNIMLTGKLPGPHAAGDYHLAGAHERTVL